MSENSQQLPRQAVRGLDLGWLLELPQNWDTYGAPRISQAAVRTAQSVRAVPMADGGIQLEIHAGGAEVEIEIRPDGQVRNILMERVDA